MKRLRTAAVVAAATHRCAFCNKRVPRESSREMLLLDDPGGHLHFCSQNCLESYAEIELGRPVRILPGKPARF